MAVPAIFFLESSKPLSYVGSQVMVFRPFSRASFVPSLLRIRGAHGGPQQRGTIAGGDRDTRGGGPGRRELKSGAPKACRPPDRAAGAPAPDRAGAWRDGRRLFPSVLVMASSRWPHTRARQPRRCVPKLLLPRHPISRRGHPMTAGIPSRSTDLFAGRRRRPGASRSSHLPRDVRGPSSVGTANAGRRRETPTPMRPRRTGWIIASHRCGR
jgi:hypothetical protein